MKDILLIITCLFFMKSYAQVVDKSTDPRFGSISPEIETKIKEKVEWEILWYRAELCQEVDFEKFVIRSYENKIITTRYDPKSVFLKDSLPKGQSSNEYKMVLEVVRWPESSPKLNTYLVKKYGMRFTNGIDTLIVDICNKYFKNDERYIVYYKEGSGPQMISGNTFLDISYPFCNISRSIRINDAKRLAYFKLGKYDTSIPYRFPIKSYDTEKYFQFKVDKSSFSPKSVIVRVPKSDPYNTLEVFYYTNDTTITKGDIYGLYEVKYNLHTKPKNFEQTLPVITKKTRAYLNYKIKNEDKKWEDVAYYIDLPSFIEEKEIEIKGKIDTVYFDDGEPLIIIIDDKGGKTEFVNEESVRYLIKGKGKLQVIVTGEGEIIYKKKKNE